MRDDLLMDGEIHQIKVTLLGTKPAIWRRLLVPGEMTLDRLHRVLQLAMGWQDAHLHEFQVAGQRFAKPDPFDDFGGGPPVANERTARLGTVLHQGVKATYTYDFGDGWEHRIHVEKVMAAEPGRMYPVCVGGARRCPPEDCGGVGGYEHLLDALGDPQNEEHAELKEWIGGQFDAEAFSIDEVNEKLRRLQRGRGKR